MADDSAFLDGRWGPATIDEWRGWLKNVPCCFLTSPCSNSLHVDNGQLTHRAGTLTTHFLPHAGSLRSNFRGSWREEGCIVLLPLPLCLPACGRGEMRGRVREDGALELFWWDDGCNNEQAVWSRQGAGALSHLTIVAPIQESMPQMVGAPTQEPMAKYAKAAMSGAGFLGRMMLKQQCIRSGKRQAEAGQAGQTYAFVPDWGMVPDDKLMKHWSGQHKVLPEYQRASERISLDQDWMGNTQTLMHIQLISTSFSAELQGIRQDRDAFSNVMHRVIQRAYGLRDGSSQAARSQRDVVSQQPVLDKVKQCYDALEEWKRPLFIHAWQVILDCETDSGAIVTKLSEVVDRALHCRQVQVQAFQLVLSCSARLLVGARERHDADQASKADEQDVFSTALHRFYECFEDFLDDYKERAFSAAFVEPTRFYWMHAGVGPGFLKDNVETHANNWYIALLNAALGVHIPIMATYWDDFAPPVCDFWAGLHDAAWQEYFSKPAHFGKGWQSIPGLRRAGKALIRKQVRTGCLPDTMAGSRNSVLGATYNVNMTPAKQFANNLINPKGSMPDRRALALYLERFASFFERDCFVQSAFETLNSECKPEHHGFRAAFTILFEAYRREQEGILEETYAEHCYRDDMFMQLDIERTSSLFAWLGILKAKGHLRGAAASCALPKEASNQEMKVASVESSPGTSSDIRLPNEHASTHFLDALKSDIFVASKPDELADLMGMWQQYEMTSALPEVRKSAIDLVRDMALCAHLDRVLANGNSSFMRDSAGLWCRFHAMVVDEEISILPAEALRLQRIVEGALAAFEADGGGAPQHVGAMYAQLASALLCAIMSNSSTVTLVQLTRQVGKACVCLHSNRFKNAAAVRELLPREYVEPVSDAVWGGVQSDIVLQTFFR